MSPEISKASKNGAVQVLADLLGAKIEEALADLEAATEARNSDTKSSAGDKHETGRAMMQMEVDNAARQLQKMRLLKSECDQIDFKVSGPAIAPGSYVSTNTMVCLISVGIGKLPAPFELCFAISPASPMGRALLGKAKGAKFEFLGKEIHILDVL